jgi:hypothetical protein
MPQLRESHPATMLVVVIGLCIYAVVFFAIGFGAGYCWR